MSERSIAEVVREIVSIAIPDGAVLPPEGLDGVEAFVVGEASQWSFVDLDGCYSLERVNVGDNKFSFRFAVDNMNSDTAVNVALLNICMQALTPMDVF